MHLVDKIIYLFKLVKTTSMEYGSKNVWYNLKLLER